MTGKEPIRIAGWALASPLRGKEIVMNLIVICLDTLSKSSTPAVRRCCLKHCVKKREVPLRG